MTSPQNSNIEDLLRDWAWLPLDYRRMRARIHAGEFVFGFEWFDRPRRPAEVGDAALLAHFPSAIWIGRRHGQLIGYEQVDSNPSLCEWKGSQARVHRRFANMADLVLSQCEPSSDLRPVVAYEFHVEGMAFGAWHDAGTSLNANCILLVGQEELGITRLMARTAPNWELTMVKSDNDSWLSVRREAAGFALLHARHGSAGDWYTVDHQAALGELMALAPYNSGAYPQYFAAMTITR